MIKYRTEIRVRRRTFRDGEKKPFLEGESPLIVVHSDSPEELLKKIEEIAMNVAI